MTADRPGHFAHHMIRNPPDPAQLLPRH